MLPKRRKRSQEEVDSIMRRIRKDIFVLLIGHGRSGTSITTGMINLSPKMNLGFERNQISIARASNPRYEKMFMKKKIPYFFNGNKIAFGGNKIMSKDVIKCINFRTGFIHERFNEIRFIFIHRNPVDTVCSQFMRNILNGKISDDERNAKRKVRSYIHNMKTIGEMKEFAESEYGGYFSFDFYDFLTYIKVRQKIFHWIGEEWDPKYNGIPIRTVMYKKKPISPKLVNYIGGGPRQDVIDWVTEEFRKKGYDYKRGSLP